MIINQYNIQSKIFCICRSQFSNYKWSTVRFYDKLNKGFEKFNWHDWFLPFEHLFSYKIKPKRGFMMNSC